MNTTTCPKCGARLHISDFPFCPHGKSTLSVVANDIPGGRIYHNLGHTPIRIDSRSELRREMKARGLMEAVSHETEVGTDKNPHTQRFVSVDLDGAREMLERMAKCPAVGKPDPDAPSDATLQAAHEAWDRLSAQG